MINLLPYNEKKRTARVRIIRFINTVLVGIIIILCVGAILLVPTILMIKNRFTLANTQVTLLAKEDKLANEVDINKVQERATLVQQKLTTSSFVQPTTRIEMIKSYTPLSIMIVRFNATSSSRIEVYGTTPSREVLQNFVTNLSADKSVASVENPLSNFVRTKEGTFTITVIFK